MELSLKAAKTVCRLIDNILTYCQYSVTKAMSDVLNSNIQKINSMACSFLNIEHFKTAVTFPEKAKHSARISTVAPFGMHFC